MLPCPLIAGTTLQSLLSSVINLGSAESPTIKLSAANFLLSCKSFSLHVYMGQTIHIIYFQGPQEHPQCEGRIRRRP